MNYKNFWKKKDSLTLTFLIKIHTFVPTASYLSYPVTLLNVMRQCIMTAMTKIIRFKMIIIIYTITYYNIITHYVIRIKWNVIKYVFFYVGQIFIRT